MFLHKSSSLNITNLIAIFLLLSTTCRCLQSSSDDYEDNAETIAASGKVDEDDDTSRLKDDRDNRTSSEGSSEEGEDNLENVCTAKYFIDRMIPKDYPEVIPKNVSNLNETINRFNRLYDFMGEAQTNMSPFTKDLASRLYDYIYESELDPQCTLSLLRVLSEIQHQNAWALGFLDSSGSILTGGFQEGMFVSLGEFDQCISINNDKESIYGQYCLVKPKFALPSEKSYNQGDPLIESKLPLVNKFLNDKYVKMYLELYQFMRATLLRLGICLPQRCQPVNFEHAINKLLVRKTGLSVDVGNCVTHKDATLIDTTQLVILFVFAFLFTLVVLSSVFEIGLRLFYADDKREDSDPSLAKDMLSRQLSKRYEEKPMLVQLLTTFSIIRNTRLLSIPAPGHCSQVDGIKLFLVLFFFIMNSYYVNIIWAPMTIKRFYVSGPLQMLRDKVYLPGRLYYLITYFYILCGVGASIRFRPKSFNYVVYVLQTYIGYVLPVLFSVGLIIVLPIFASGPLWHLFNETISENCRHNYLSTVLFYNNLDEKLEDKCNPFTMLVSCAFQFKLVAPIFLLVVNVLTKSNKLKRIILVVVYLLITATSIIPRLHFDVKHYLEYQDMTTFTEIKTSLVFYNFNPAFHLASFVLGMLVGNLIDNPPVKQNVSRRVMMLSGAGSFILLASYIYCIEQIDVFNPQLHLGHTLLILTVGQICIALFFCWIILASTIGNYRILSQFLSSPVLTWMCNLSYGFVVCSSIAIFYRIFTIRQPITLEPQIMFRLIVSDALLSFLLSYLVHLLVCAPYKNMIGVLKSITSS